MESSLGTEYPRLCAEVGLSCEECTSSTAAELARACRGLRGKMIGQMFVQIHTHSACAKMHAHFAESYRAASTALLEMQGVERKGVAREEGQSIAAVA